MRDGIAEAITHAVADHLSTRAAESIARPELASSLTHRAAFVLDALERAARCPLCAPELLRAGLLATRAEVHHPDCGYAPCEGCGG